LRPRQGIVTGVAGQALSSITNFLPALLAGRWLEPEKAGTVILALSAVFVALGIQRAIIGEPMLSRVASSPEPEKRELARHGLSTALLIGLFFAAVGIILWISGLSIAEGMIWAAPWIPFILVQDAARSSLFGDGRADRALVLDMQWLIVQILLLIPWLLVNTKPPWCLIAAWGFGGFVSAAFYLVSNRVNLLAGRPSQWFRLAGRLSAWFAGQAVLAQLQYQFVLIIVAALLSKAAAGGLRIIQLIALQPVQTLLLAAVVVLTPRIARRFASDGLSEVRRFTRRATQGMALLWTPWLLVCLFRDDIVGAIFPNFLAYSELVIPVALTGLLYCLQAPMSISLRATQMAGAIFTVQVVFSFTSIAFVSLGAAYFGLDGAAWGYFAGSACQLCAASLAYRRSLSGKYEMRQLGS